MLELLIIKRVKLFKHNQYSRNYLPDNIIEIQAFPESNDVVGLKDLYLSFDVSNSRINMIKDVIASGEDISGVSFTRDYYTSSYSNGALRER